MVCSIARQPAGAAHLMVPAPPSGSPTRSNVPGAARSYFHSNLQARILDSGRFLRGNRRGRRRFDFKSLQRACPLQRWDSKAATAQVAFSVPALKSLPKPPSDAAERRYALRLVQQRLQQATFRAAVITAYKGRCALSGMPESLLLDAAHIIVDKDEQYGQPIVQNGIPLSKIHHAAFDAHLIGLDSDFRVHVSKRLFVQKMARCSSR